MEWKLPAACLLGPASCLWLGNGKADFDSEWVLIDSFSDNGRELFSCQPAALAVQKGPSHFGAFAEQDIGACSGRADCQAGGPCDSHVVLGKSLYYQIQFPYV